MRDCRMKISEIEYEAQRAFGCEGVNIRVTRGNLAACRARMFVISILYHIGYDYNKIIIRYRLRSFEELKEIVHDFDKLITSDLKRDAIFFLKQIRKML